MLAIDIFYYQNFKRQAMIIFLKNFLFRRTKSKSTQFYLENFVFNNKFQNWIYANKFAVYAKFLET